MLPVTSLQSYSRFRRLIRETEKNLKEHSSEDDFEEKLKELNRRLNSIRDGYEQKPLSGNYNVVPENHELLNDNNSKRQRYGVFCPDCQDVYIEGSKRYREAVIYRDVDTRVEISS